MQISVNITGFDAVKAKLAALGPQKTVRAASMAINKTAAKSKSEINRAVTQRYQIARSEVSNSVTIASASAAKPQATISVFGSTKKRGRSLNMIHFVERKVSLAEGRRRAEQGDQNQIRYNIIKGQGGKMIKGSFIGNKGRTIFIREGKSRLPIQPVQVIGVSGMFNYGPLKQRVLNKIEKEFAVELNRAVNKLLSDAS